MASSSIRVRVRDSARRLHDLETQCPLPIPAAPAMPRMEMHAAFAQTMQPGAQQRCGLHAGGKDAAGGADESVDAEAMYPLAQGVGRKAAQQRLDVVTAGAIAGEKGLE